MAAIPLRRIEGKYEILGKLGEGGMGSLYKVRHRLLDEIRVVKLMQPQFVQDEELKARFQREARMAIKLRHPNVAQLYDFTVDEDDGTAFIVMEFISGLTLEDVFKATGPPPLGLGLEIGQQSLKALGYLHGRGFIHRDISPDNLMLTEDTEGQPLVKLIDLGIAKVLGGADGHRTATGAFLGKIRYCSPEQFGFDGAPPMDARGDLYSFGIVLYELLTGRYPIQGRDLSAIMAGHLFRPPLDFAESDPEGRLPAGLREVLLAALAKAPADRPQSAQELSRALAPFRAPQDFTAEDFRRILSSLPLAGAEPAGPGSTQERLDLQFGLAPTPPPISLITAAPPRPHDAEIRNLAATIARHLESGDLLPAEAELRWALESFGPQPELDGLRSRLVDLQAGEARRQAQEAVAAARDRLAAGDPDAAIELLHAARALDAAEPDGPGLLAEAKTALAQRAEAEQRAREEAAAEIAGALERGDTRAAETALYAAEARFGAHQVFADLHAQLAERRRRDLAERRRAELAAAAERRIAGLLAAGRLDEAAALLADATADATAEPEPRFAALAARLAELREQALRDEVAALLAEARELAARSDYPAALEQLERAAERVPGDAAVTAERAAVAAAARQWAEEQRHAEQERRADEERRAAEEQRADEERRRSEEEQRRVAAEERRAEKERQAAADEQRRRAARLAEAVGRIAACLDRGELDRASDLLDRAVAAFGAVDPLREHWQRLEALRHAKPAPELKPAEMATVPLAAAGGRRELPPTIRLVAADFEPPGTAAAPPAPPALPPLPAAPPAADLPATETLPAAAADPPATGTGAPLLPPGWKLWAAVAAGLLVLLLLALFL